MASETTVSMDDAVIVNGLFDVDALISMDDMEGAEDAFNDILKVDDKSAELHYRYGNFIRRQYSDFERAETQWKLAVEIDANHTLALFALAMLNKNEFQNYGESIKYFKRVLDIKPTFGVAWKEYGDLLGFRLGDWKNAEYAYDQSDKYEHAFKWNALNNASYGLAFKLNKAEKAEKYLLRSIQISPHGINHANLGRIYFDVFKDDEKAEKVLRAGLAIQENQSRAREYLGKVLAKRKDDPKAIDEAKKHWVRAIELGNDTVKPLLEALIQWETKGQSTGAAEDAEDSKEEEKQVTVATRNTLTILDAPSSSIAASANRKVLCSGDEAGNIMMYDLMSLDPGALDQTSKYPFYFVEGLNCNGLCFSEDDTLLAAAFAHPTSTQSTLVIFNISTICKDGLSKENIAKCSEPLYKTTLLNKINTNALKFSDDGERLLIGTTLKYGMEIPLHTMGLSDGKLSTGLYSKVLLNQASWPTAVNNVENVVSLDLVHNILCCGTSKGRVLVIDVSTDTLLHQYHHRETNCSITAVLMTTDLRWIISSDIYGAMNFYFVQLKTDGYPKPAAIGAGSIPKTTIDAKAKHDLIYDIVFIKAFDDVHFRAVSELQGHKDKLICSSSYDGNLALFELTNNDFYTNKPTVRVISRVESSHEYLAINSASWIITDVLGLCLFTTGDDLRIILHGLTDILLEAVPEFLQMHKKKKHRHFAFDAEDTDKSRQILVDLIDVETHKLNGWVNLWAFDLQQKKKEKEEEARTADMAIAALSTFQRLTDSVILYLIEDKVKYERVFKRLVSDANDIDGLAQIERLFTNVIAKQSYYDEKIKQPNGDLIQLLSDANACNEELQRLANALAGDAAVSGMYEGNPGIKKMTRSVEKALLKCMEFGIEYDSGLDFAFLKDLARAGVTCRDCMKIAAALDKLVNNKGIQVLRIKNRFVPQSELGYRDILVNLRFVDEKSGELRYNGHIAELQLHHEKIQAVRKKGKGHANYSASRFLMDFIRITTKKKTQQLPQKAVVDTTAAAAVGVAAPQQTIEKGLKELWGIH